jgi:diaminopimelate epimerase
MTTTDKSTNAAKGICFHKMHGAGNDFILLDLREQSLDLTTEKAGFLADRRLGIGCDQLLILRPARQTGSLLSYEIRNADGAAAGQCGNGARCIALYLYMRGESDNGTMLLESPSGLIQVDRCPDGEFELDMGEPDFEPAEVPVSLIPEGGRYLLDSPWGQLSFAAVSMGNPHAVVDVEEIKNAPLETTGAFLSHNPGFTEGCNAGFVQVVDRDNIHLRVFERGVGETLACGSGACAAVAVLRQAGRVNELVNVFQPGGHLVIKWSGAGSGIRMKGPAMHVFKGKLNNE